MNYNEFVTVEEIKEYDKIIDQDLELLNDISYLPQLREVIRAGMLLFDKLHQLNFAENQIIELQYKAGKESYNKDPWIVYNEIYQDCVKQKNKSLN